MISALEFIYMMNHIYLLIYVAPSLHLWDDVDSIMVNNFWMCS